MAPAGDAVLSPEFGLEHARAAATASKATTGLVRNINFDIGLDPRE